MKKMIFYGIDEDAYRAYQEIGEGMEIEVGVCCDMDLVRTVSYLMEHGGTLGDAQFTDPCMIFEGLTKTELLTFLQIAKVKGHLFEGLKVLRYEENEKWILAKLLNVTFQEKRCYDKSVTLRQMLYAIQKLSFEEGDPRKQRLDQTRQFAMSLLNQNVYDENDLDQALRMLAAVIRNDPIR